MAVSKRLRFEILRRDNHACRYCGRTAPDVALTVDHVVAVALGGNDDPSNLVTACAECNSGKSATPADAQIVANVSDDAFRWAAAMRAAFDQALGDLERRDAYLDSFEDHWNRWVKGAGDGTRIPLPDDWQRSVSKWYGLSYPIEMLHDAIDTAMRKRGLRGYDAEFRYMAGIVWGTITELQRQVAATLPASFTPPITGHECDDEDCPTKRPCRECGQVGCVWACGFGNGESQGWTDCYDAFSYEIYQMRALTRVIDRGGFGPNDDPWAA